MLAEPWSTSNRLAMPIKRLLTFFLVRLHEVTLFDPCHPIWQLHSDIRVDEDQIDRLDKRDP